MRRLAVYAGARSGADPAYARATAALGREMARRGLGVGYGGAGVGLMGVVADAVLEGGGSVTGVLPRALMTRELAHPGVSDLRVVETMHERKALMAGLADAFVVLPGGFGTWEEAFEVVTWLQLGFHAKPVGLLNVAGYYDALLRFVDRAVGDGFVPEAGAARLWVEVEPERLLDRVAGVRAGSGPAAGSGGAPRT